MRTFVRVETHKSLLPSPPAGVEPKYSSLPSHDNAGGPSPVRALDPADIHAARLPDASASAAVRKAHAYDHDSRSCRLKVTLDEIAPPIWRRLDVPASVTLARLHDVLQAALGWTNSHLHMFEIGDQRIAIPYDLEQLLDGQITRSARLVKLGDIVDHGVRRFTYEYDFGDSWRHNRADRRGSR